MDIDQDKKIEELYREMFHPCLVYAKSTLNDINLAEEAVQDTFRIACEKTDDLLSSPNPKGWLIKTLKNVIRNMKKTRVQINKIVVSTFVFDEIPCTDSDNENPDLLYSGTINDEDFALLKKIGIDGSSMLEMAEELGISVEACKKRVQRAKQKFKKNFEK